MNIEYRPRPRSHVRIGEPGPDGAVDLDAIAYGEIRRTDPPPRPRLHRGGPNA